MMGERSNRSTRETSNRATFAKPARPTKPRRRAIGARLGALLLLVTASGFAWTAQAVEIERWTTADGLRVLFVAAPEPAMLDIRLTFDAGSARDGEQKGLASLTSTALQHGGGDLDADDLARAFESVGADFSTESARDMGSVSLRTLTESDWMEQAVQTFTAVLAEPAFPEAEFERSKRATLQAIQREGQEPGSVLRRTWWSLAYAGHPYASMPVGRPDSVRELSVDDARRFFDRYYVRENAVLALVGAVDRETAETLAARIASALPEGERAAPLPPPPVHEEAAFQHVPFPSEQAHVYIGQPLATRDDPAYFDWLLANHVLGGGSFNSRLFQDLRTRQGLAYSVFSVVQPMAAPGPFVAGLQTASAQAGFARDALHEAIRDWHDDGVTDDELEAARANLVNGFPLSVASNSAIVSQLAMIGFYDLPLDWLDGYVARIKAVTRESLDDAVRAAVRPEGMVTVVVGGDPAAIDAAEVIDATLSLDPTAANGDDEPESTTDEAGAPTPGQ